MKTSPGFTHCANEPAHDQEIMVSVLAIAYNHEAWIGRALDSIVTQQTDFPIEILVQDDASTDRTAEIIKEYGQKYPTLIRPIYYTENQYSQGRSPLLLLSKHAIGKYLSFCECDDYWTDPLKLQKQVALLEAHPECSMCVARSDVYKLEDGQFLYQQTFHGIDKALLYFDDFFNGCYLHTSTFVIPKNIFRSTEKYWDKIPLSDTSLRYILLDIGPFIFLRETVSVYQITGQGVWSAIDRYTKAASQVKLFEAFYSHFDPKYKKYWAMSLLSNYMDLLSIDIRKRRLGNIPKNGMRMAYLGLRYAPLYMLKVLSGSSLRFIKKKMNGISI